MPRREGPSSICGEELGDEVKRPELRLLGDVEAAMPGTGAEGEDLCREEDVEPVYEGCRKGDGGCSGDA